MFREHRVPPRVISQAEKKAAYITSQVARLKKLEEKTSIEHTHEEVINKFNKIFTPAVFKKLCAIILEGIDLTEPLSKTLLEMVRKKEDHTPGHSFKYTNVMLCTIYCMLDILERLFKKKGIYNKLPSKDLTIYLFAAFALSVYSDRNERLFQHEVEHWFRS